MSARKPAAESESDQLTSFWRAVAARSAQITAELMASGQRATQAQAHSSILLLGLLCLRLAEAAPVWRQRFPRLLDLWQQYRPASITENSFQRRSLLPFLQALNESAVPALNGKSTAAAKGGSTKLPIGPLALLTETCAVCQRFALSDRTWEMLLAWLYEPRFSLRPRAKQAPALSLEILGQVYESLSPMARRSTNGVFYTSRAEAELMARLALGQWLQSELSPQLSSADANSVLDLLTTPEPMALDHQARKLITRSGLQSLFARLEQLKMIDPACGAGALLLAVQQVALELAARLARLLRQPFNRFAFTRDFIARSLYGIDTDAQAVAVTEAQLWLTLLAESPAELPALVARRLIVADGLTITDTVLARRFKLNELQPASGRTTALGQFDIVIGNPPFVRHEKIGQDKRRNYKEQLQARLAQDWPNEEISGRADLHAFFFYRGLALLRERGVLCLLAPNAWLDIGYGDALKRFLLAQSEFCTVISDERQRSFTARINTVITLATKAQLEASSKSLTPVRCLAIRRESQPAEIVAAALTSEIRPGLNRREFVGLVSNSLTSNNGHKGNGMRPANRAEADLIGNRWSLYLRAPALVFTLLHRLRPSLARLSELGQVRYPIKTGINEFFFLSRVAAEAHRIEPDYLVPVVKSPKQFQQIRLAALPATLLFSCQLSPRELQQRGHQGALAYIRWGETQATAEGTRWPEVASVRNRPLWYALPRLRPAHVICNRFFDQRFFFGYSRQPVIEDQTFYGLTLEGGPALRQAQIALLNSTLSFLLVELFGRVTLGDGVLQFATYEMAQLPAVKANSLSVAARRELTQAFRPLAQRPILPIFEEVRQADRQVLDEVVGRWLGITPREQQRISYHLLELVETRLAKARKSRTIFT